jgi:hypothetical protein
VGRADGSGTRPTSSMFVSMLRSVDLGSWLIGVGFKSRGVYASWIAGLNYGALIA